jgi:hypothetical protein
VEKLDTQRREIRRRWTQSLTLSYACGIIAAEMPVSPLTDDIEITLRNWAAWARIPKHPAHCGSIEYRYRSPQCWFPPAPQITIDHAAAIEVERLTRFLPARWHMALKYRYVYLADPRWCARRLAVHIDDWPDLLADARSAIGNLLTRAEQRAHTAGRLSIPVPAETWRLMALSPMDDRDRSLIARF